jgi:putative spermidine/putrescine transport system ATP-binding protein
VTHDQSEALTMADRIAVFDDGVIQQLSTPDDLYEKPANAFVAQFIGENNRLKGTVRKIDGNACVVELDCGSTMRAEKVNVGGVGARATLSIRPERIELAPKKGSMTNNLHARIEELIYLGDHIRVRMSVSRTDNFVVKVRNAAGQRTLKVGEKMNVGWHSQDCRALDLNGA